MEINKEVKLGDLVEIKGGKRLPRKESLSSIPNEHPYIRVRDIQQNAIVIKDLAYVPIDIFPLIKNYIVSKGDIIISIVGSIGFVAQIQSELDKASLTENCVKLTHYNLNKIDPKYLFYFLTSPIGQHEINSKVVGSTQPKLPIYNIKNIEISLPPLSEQHRIANILSSFDNKIELLRKENNTLEDIAQSIFKEWFVKYNFPNKDGKPYKDNNGKMIDSELGLIPEGWRVGKLGEFGKIVCGKTPPKNIPEYFNGKYPFIKIPDMQDMFIVRSEDSLTELGAKQLSGKLLPSGSICVSCIATIGKVSITTQDSFTNQQINTIIPKEGTLEYLYFTLSNMKGYLEQIGNRGSTTFNINTQMFSNLLVAYPPESIIMNYHTNANTLLISIQKNMVEIETMLKVKNILINHLIG